MANAPTPEATGLIAEHKKAINNLKRAERLALLLPLSLLLVVAVTLWWQVSQFFAKGIRQTTQSIIAQAPETVSPVLGTLTDSLGRIAPIYRAEISRVWERDQQIYHNLISSQSEQFTRYAAGLQPLLKKRAEEIMSKILLKVEQQLAPDLTADERELFEEQIALALYDRLYKEVEAQWQPHMTHVENISNNLALIAQTEPDTTDLKPAYLMGAGLEVLGIKLKELNR
jgi:hypothetical protein